MTEEAPTPTPSDRPRWYDLVIGFGGAVIGGAFAIGGSLVTTNAEADRQEAAVQVELERETRDLRRPIYQELLDASNGFAVAHRQRATCIPGTDEPREPAEQCALSTEGLQTARYRMAGALNDLWTIGSPQALLVMTRIVDALPSAYAGPDGRPPEGTVDDESFSEAYRAFLDVTACDTQPDPIIACDRAMPAVTDAYDDLLDQLNGEQD